MLPAKESYHCPSKRTMMDNLDSSEVGRWLQPQRQGHFSLVSEPYSSAKKVVLLLATFLVAYIHLINKKIKSGACAGQWQQQHAGKKESSSVYVFRLRAQPRIAQPPKAALPCA
jgi:hypothetical protein